MKKLLFIIVATFITCATFAQRNKTNYEKYWQAKEDSITKSQMTLSKYNTENQMTSINTQDTLQATVDTLAIENPDINVNYYYNTDPFYYSNQLGYYNHGMSMWFNYRYNNDFYFGYNPWFYDDYYFGYNYGYPWRYNYWGYNYGYNYYNHHNYNHYGYGNNYGGLGQRYNTHERFGSGRYVNNGGVSKRVAPEGRMRFTSPNNRNVSNQRSNQKATYSQSKRNYSPSYNQPRMNTRPAYNNSSTTRRNMNTMPQRNTNIGTQRRTESRIYSAPTNRSFESSRNYNSGNASRSSNSNYNSGSRSSNSYSGSNHSSGSNYSSGSRSSSSNYSGGGGGSRSSGGGTGRR